MRIIDLRKQKYVDANIINQPIEVTTVSGGEQSTVVSVNATTSSVTLKAANSSRTGLTIHNESDNVLYVKYGSSASPTSFTGKLFSGDWYHINDYRGLVSGVWNGTSGFAVITETF